MIADSGAALVWVRWASPLGWVEELRPLTGSRAAVAAAGRGLIAVLAAATVVLAGRRDLGASVLPARDTAVAGPDCSAVRSAWPPAWPGAAPELARRPGRRRADPRD